MARPVMTIHRERLSFAVHETFEEGREKTTVLLNQWYEILIEHQNAPDSDAWCDRITMPVELLGFARKLVCQTPRGPQSVLFNSTDVTTSLRTVIEKVAVGYATVRQEGE